MQQLALFWAQCSDFRQLLHREKSRAMWITTQNKPKKAQGKKQNSHCFHRLQPKKQKYIGLSYIVCMLQSKRADPRNWKKSNFEYLQWGKQKKQIQKRVESQEEDFFFFHKNVFRPPKTSLI